MELKVLVVVGKTKARECFNRTFMELKGDHHVIHIIVYHVSIAPLWNWKRKVQLRTDCGLLFQSHLYGIESDILDWLDGGLGVSIAPLWNWKTIDASSMPVNERFNRTFMELKVGRTLEKVLKCEFQSHLYGIERTICEHVIAHGKVSIAPLWNWKGHHARASLYHHAGFNRTFMELKDCLVLTLRNATPVSIAPLWNWKNF